MVEENNICNLPGCSNLTAWANKKEKRYSRGGYFRSRCYSCSNLLQNYGITTPERDGILDEQGSRCLICETEISFNGSSNQTGMANNAAVDHCHDSGKVRGILCMQCNLDLGKYEKLKPKFNAFAKYVELYGGQ